MRGDTSDARTQAGKRHPLHVRCYRLSFVAPGGEDAIFHQQERRAARQVGVYRVVQYHRHAHGRSGDQVRDTRIVGLDYLRGPDEQLTMMALHDEPLEPLLHVPPEVPAVQQVDAAIHKAEAVGGADDGVARDVEDRAPMYAHAFEVTAIAVPRIGKRRLDGG